MFLNFRMYAFVVFLALRQVFLFCFVVNFTLVLQLAGGFLVVVCLFVLLSCYKICCMFSGFVLIG